MAGEFSQEFRLAAACAMWPPSEHRNEAIRAAAIGPLDWSRFLRVSRRHQVVGLVHDGLNRALIDLPPEITREIGIESGMLVRQNLAMAGEACRLNDLFEAANIPVLFVKGASLALLAFGNLSLRVGQDIDLLVPYESMSAATTLICNAGYRRVDPPLNISDAQLQLLMPIRKDIGFVHQATRLRIELHWRLFTNPHAMAHDSIMEMSQVVQLTGSKGLRTMGEEDLFAYLCMHGALHWWNRLKWLADINALVTTEPERIERLVRAAETKGAGRPAAQAVQLCRRLLGMPIPVPLLATVPKSLTERWLEATALNAMTLGQGEHDPHDTKLGTTRGSLSTFLLSRSWRYRLAELRIHLMNQDDILAIPLPTWLRYLYPIMRAPLWVWRHASRRR